MSIQLPERVRVPVAPSLPPVRSPSPFAVQVDVDDVNGTVVVQLLGREDIRLPLARIEIGQQLRVQLGVGGGVPVVVIPSVQCVVGLDAGKVVRDRVPGQLRDVPVYSASVDVRRQSRLEFDCHIQLDPHQRPLGHEIPRRGLLLEELLSHVHRELEVGACGDGHPRAVRRDHGDVMGRHPVLGAGRVGPVRRVARGV